jgi:hypothetical protein
LNIGLVLISGTAVLSAGRADWKASAHDAAALFSVSAKTNVLVVLLDGLQADIAAGVLEQHPTLGTASQQRWREVLRLADLSLSGSCRSEAGPGSGIAVAGA